MDTARITEYAARTAQRGVIADCHGMGVCEEPECGDTLRVTLSVEREVITGLRYEITESACPPAKACAAAMAELALGRAVVEAYLVGAEAISALLGGLDRENMHCAMMAELALKRACVDYSRRKKAGLERT